MFFEKLPSNRLVSVVLSVSVFSFRHHGDDGGSFQQEQEPREEKAGGQEEDGAQEEAQSRPLLPHQLRQRQVLLPLPLVIHIHPEDF